MINRESNFSETSYRIKYYPIKKELAFQPIIRHQRNGVGPCGIVSTTRAISSRWKEKQKCSNLMLIKIKKSEIKTIFTLTSLVLFKNGN